MNVLMKHTRPMQSDTAPNVPRQYHYNIRNNCDFKLTHGKGGDGSLAYSWIGQMIDSDKTLTSRMPTALTG